MSEYDNIFITDIGILANNNEDLLDMLPSRNERLHLESNYENNI